MPSLLACALAAGLSLLTGAAQAQAGTPPASGTAASAVRPVEDTMAGRMQACTVCHGREGRATNAGYFPRIAGKPEGYLFNQLVNFREERRHNPAMNHLMRHLSDDYLREIARYFAALDLPYPPARPHGLSADRQALAERLVFDGAPARGIPACTACHGARMAGRLPAMPGLLTLPALLLSGLDPVSAIATNKLQGSAGAVSSTLAFARRLSAEEASAVAHWLSAQTLPPGTRPDAAVAGPMPLRCGSGL